MITKLCLFVHNLELPSAVFSLEPGRSFQWCFLQSRIINALLGLRDTLWKGRYIVNAKLTKG